MKKIERITKKNLIGKAVVFGIAFIFVFSAFIPAVNSQVEEAVCEISLESKDSKISKEGFGENFNNEHYKDANNNLIRSKDKTNDLSNVKKSVIQFVDKQLTSEGKEIDYSVKTPYDPSTLDVCNSWWNTSWSYRKEITIDHVMVEDNLVNFPILINIIDDDLKDHAQDTGYDIVFTNEYAVKLNHEIERYDDTSGELIAWINVTSLSSVEDTILYMYYGNSAALNQQNVAGTWDSQYKMVQHLNEVAGTVNDSTMYENDGAITGATHSPSSKINGGYSFDGDDYITISNDSSLWLTDGITVECWADPVDQQYSGLVSKAGVAEWGIAGWGMDYQYNGAFDLQLGDKEAMSVGTYDDPGWKYMVGSWSKGEAIELFVDAVEVSYAYQTIRTDDISNTDKSVWIGAYYNIPSHCYSGNGIDEVRVSGIKRSEEWIQTSYNTMNFSSMFLSVGEEETVPADTTPPTTTHHFTPITPDGLNGWYVSNVSITFSATDTESGVAWTKYSSNNGVTWTTHNGPWPFDVVLSDGEHQLLYYSQDNKGNEELVNGPFELKIDITIPDQRFFSFHGILGPLLLFILNIGLVRDGCSGLDRVEFYLNDEFHHQMDLSSWPVGIWRIVVWLYPSPSVGDNCTGVVYDKAGNWKQMKPNVLQTNSLVPEMKENLHHK